MMAITSVAVKSVINSLALVIDKSFSYALIVVLMTVQGKVVIRFQSYRTLNCFWFDSICTFVPTVTSTVFKSAINSLALVINKKIFHASVVLLTTVQMKVIISLVLDYT